MSPKLAACILALALFLVTFAVNLQAPLYDLYVGDGAMGATAVTLGFAAYVAGLMPTLVGLGGLSDRVGRRWPIALALMLGATATLLMIVAPGWPALIAARVILGVGTALATTSGAAYMAEILGADRNRLAAQVVTAATSLGFGGGALATGLSLALQGQTMMPASYLALVVTAPVLALLALVLPRVDQPRRVSPLRLPVFPRGGAVYGLALALAWSTTGMTIAVVPLELAADGLRDWSGLVIFLAIFVGFLCQPVARRMTNGRAVTLGFALVPAGYLILLLGVQSDRLALVLVGTGVSSAASYGFTYLAALSEVGRRAPEDRARATAGLFVYAYAGFSVPVIGSGVLADWFGLGFALAAFGAALLVGTALTLVVWASSDTRVHG
ncbi:MFS transporter [Tabrizicola sp. TH137]|uniref:MFS transporter n=1 Tax=Tabrizicola sp. TH137 TaxID=2067452 RepID=UPI000C7E0F07|nr:MFS transporter [Tabrizicola sp. TH137]PLL10193.1 MFS transporter [Tabrizicola sp. TH137]